MTIDDLAVAAVRAAPFGCFKLAKALRAVRPSLAWYPTPTRYGTMMCDITEPICFDLVRFGEYKWWAEDETLFGQLAKDRVVVDVGANIGATVRIFERGAREIHAFEPAPRALPFLRANSGPKTTVYPFALSDHEGTAKFAERDKLDYSSFADEGIDVPVRTLDSFDLKPDLIKIDVEGFEPQVIRGARQTLKDLAPAIIFEALTDEQLEECRTEILSANPRYRFERISELNHLARC